MKFVKFWSMQARELSLSERMFYRDAIRTLQAWDIVRKEFGELELIKNILEREINVLPADLQTRQANSRKSHPKT